MASQLALGLMSGTSADGLSLAVLEEGPRGVRVAASDDRAYPRAFQKKLLSARTLRAPELAALHFELGQLYAREAVRFLKKIGIPAKRLAVVGSHGQTVCHRGIGSRAYTLQIGEPSFLAESLGVPVVSDFRPRDMAAGGEGAPIVPFFDEAVFGGGVPRVLLNIGGIANLSLVGKGLRTFGFDTGPGNCLIDLAVSRMSRGRFSFDRGGRIAQSGAVDENAVFRFLKAPFFKAAPPKSLDRSEFSEGFFEKYFPSGKQASEDVVSTVSFFTAASIAEALRRFVFPKAKPSEMIVSGGGAFNVFLMDELRRLLKPLPILSIAERGIPPLAKEPAAIALMALRLIEGRMNHCPAATGAKGVRILGKLTR